MKPPAIGYLRKDVSGSAQPWDETRIRGLAKRLGFDLTKIVALGEHTDDPLQRLLNVIARTAAETVFVPSAEHFGGEIPESLIAVCNVVTVDTEHTHARALPSLFDPPANPGDLHGDSHSRDRVPALGGRGLADLPLDLPPLT